MQGIIFDAGSFLSDVFANATLCLNLTFGTDSLQKTAMECLPWHLPGIELNLKPTVAEHKSCLLCFLQC